ncbi:Argonaute siRNA chaperone complex subunit Arb1-domain-containing protein [Bipolaris maydis]|nr:Argonaute siRNA chaperone complex subunit Arb1-domain-containing protein [Bipolaris maydis]
MSTAGTPPTADAGSSDEASQNHPDGADIRRQVCFPAPVADETYGTLTIFKVEYYFSDENLPTDTHLLQFCGGRENLPVSINRICGFPRMRQYKPKSLVIAALRLSNFLEVSADGKTIKRKIPLQGKCLLDLDFFDDEDIAYDPRVQKPAPRPVPFLQIKKDAHLEGVSKNMKKPTGFERTYVEPLLTADEAAQEDDMYASDKHFVERIEVAIQRFKNKRRMREMYAHVFNQFMRFGGVDAGPRMYQGLSKQEMNEMDAEELARALAIHHVPWDRANETQWVVDFAGVCKGFLSSWYPAHYGFAPHLIKNACQVLRSFFRYLRFHRVCPEYDDQLAAALDICDNAEEQLPKANAVGLALTGDFNKSASVVFGGAQACLYTGNKSWAEELREEGVYNEEIGISEEEAKVKLGIGIAIMGSDEQFGLYQSSKLEVLSKKSTYLEVVAIHPPDCDTKAAYDAQSMLYGHKLELQPLGKLICKTWHLTGCEEYDLPKDKYPNGKPWTSGDSQEYEFWIEGDILRDCFMGMKMDADILVLSGGLNILDNVKETMCSFYVWLPNELWMERKPKEVRWLKKGMGHDENEDQDDGNDEKEAEQVADKGCSDDEFDDE